TSGTAERDGLRDERPPACAHTAKPRPEPEACSTVRRRERSWEYLWIPIRTVLYPSGPLFPSRSRRAGPLPDARRWRLSGRAVRAGAQATYIGLLSFRFRKPFTMR